MTSSWDVTTSLLTDAVGRGLRGEDGLSLDLHDVLDFNQEDTKPEDGLSLDLHDVLDLNQEDTKPDWGAL